MQTVVINTDYIKLDQLLKFAEVIDSGGMAKLLITEGFVAVNGGTCLERGKKIRSGDRIKVSVPDAEGTIGEVVEFIVDKKV